MVDSKKTKLAVIGLGIMGLPMAKNLKAAGYSVTATTRSAKGREKAQGEGISIVPSPKEAADQADIILLIVKDPEAVKQVFSGPNGLGASSGEGKVIVQMSTIDLAATLWAAGEAQKQGFKFLDCPVAGSKKQVDAAELILLAGGDDEVLEACREPLLKVGKHIVHAGGIGKGTGLKLCMNLIVAQMTTALAESVALARVQDVDPADIFEVIENSPAINCGYFQIKKKPLLEENYATAFSLANMLKDVRFMTHAAKTKKLPLPVTQAVQFLMENAQSDGLGESDLTAIASVLKPKISA